MDVLEYFKTILIFMLFMTSNIQANGDCPSAWTRDLKRSRCIKAMDEVKKYSEAKTACSAAGAELMKIENAYDQSVVECVLRNVASGWWGYWIQMERTFENTWAFENKDVVSWFNWRSDQPNAWTWSNQECVAIELKSLKWHDMKCEEVGDWPRRPLCAKKADQGPVTETRYIKEQDGCLDKYSVLRSYSTQPTRPRVSSSCRLECTQDTCCAAMASNRNECILYKLDANHTTPECVTEAYSMYRKKY